MASEPLVIVEQQRPGVMELRLNRPAKRNALSAALVSELVESVERMEADPSQRVAIFTGAGPSFCAGLDLSEAVEPEAAERSARCVAQLLGTIGRSRLVTIAAVHGAAMAGGAGLMSACDLVVAAEGAYIGYPEVRRGLVPALVSRFLVRQVGQRWARELTLLGEPVDAERAAVMGLVNRVVAEDRLMAETLGLAAAVLRGAPAAVARTKRLLEEREDPPLEDELERALAHHMEQRRCDEAEEGLRAFLEKRDPTW